MSSDGWRNRYFYGMPSRVLVLTCTPCGHDHRLLPVDLCAYRDATLDEVEAALPAGPWFERVRRVFGAEAGCLVLLRAWLWERIALFRFGAIAELVNGPLAPGEKERLLTRLSQKEWAIPGTSRTTLGRATLRDWAAAYRAMGIEGLKPRPRNDAGTSRAIPEAVQDLLLAMRKARPKASLESLIRAMRLSGAVPAGLRMVPYAAFYASENAACFQDALEQGVLRRGVPRRLYTDNGSTYRTHHLEVICATLCIALVHSRPHHPRGRGKIERFFRTVRSAFLAHVTAEMLTSLATLNRVFWAWLEAEYHHTVHGGLDGQTPLDRLRGVDRDTTRLYLEHRLRVAGVDWPVFSEPAIEALFNASQGVFRKIDGVAHHALAAAAGARARVVDADHVVSAAGELRA